MNEAVAQQIQKYNEKTVDTIVNICRLSKYPEWPVFMEWLEEVCVSNDQAYIPGMPPEHTIFRCGCQQPAIQLKKLLKTNVSELIKNLNQGE